MNKILIGMLICLLIASALVSPVFATEEEDREVMMWAGCGIIVAILLAAFVLQQKYGNRRQKDYTVVYR